MSAVLHHGFEAHAIQMSKLQNWSAPVIEARVLAREAAKQIKQERDERENALFGIRCQLKGFTGGLSMQELADMVTCLKVSANSSLTGPVKALEDLECDFDGAAHYGHESVDWGHA